MRRSMCLKVSIDDNFCKKVPIEMFLWKIFVLGRIRGLSNLVEVGLAVLQIPMRNFALVGCPNKNLVRSVVIKFPLR
jgi:hypothetical protein